MEGKVYIIGIGAEQVSAELIERLMKERDFKGKVVFIESENDIPFGTPAMQKIDFPVMKLTNPNYDTYVDRCDTYKPRKGKNSWKSPYTFHK